MPREISGLRIARSFITPISTTPVSRVIDFQLGARQGIQIEQIAGSMSLSSLTESTDFQEESGVQTLHLESGSLETVPFVDAADEDTIDSEIVFYQAMTALFQEEAATRGGSAMALLVTPNTPIVFATPLFMARNPTHSGVMIGTTVLAMFHLTIYYKFVEFSLAELGLILARRT